MSIRVFIEVYHANGEVKVAEQENNVAHDTDAVTAALDRAVERARARAKSAVRVDKA